MADGAPDFDRERRRLGRTLDRVEAALVATTDEAVRKFLSRLRRSTLSQLSGLGGVNLLDLPGLRSRAYELWQDVPVAVSSGVREAWVAGFGTVADIPVNLAQLDVYLANVVDRLTPGLFPGLPDDAFDAVRVQVTRGISLGQSTDAVADGIGYALRWDVPDRALRQRVSALESILDDRLGHLSPEGRAAEVRRLARSDDPLGGVIRERSALRRDLNSRETAAERRAFVDGDIEPGEVWKPRARLIARTESTAAFGAGQERATADAGFEARLWVAALDARTRPEHLAASGVSAPVGQPFNIGGEALMFPGDPAGSPAMTANCRCTTIPVAAGEAGDVIDEASMRALDERIDETRDELQRTLDGDSGRSPRVVQAELDKLVSLRSGRN